jgi:predicted nucleotidyltransferase
MGGRAIYGLSGMKRKDAFRKLRTICQRLDDRDPEQFPVIPLRLYLFGSLLTDKPDPSDVDLLFKFQDRPDLDPGDIVHRLAYGKPLPREQAVKYLRRGMQMIRVEFLAGNLEDWLADHCFSFDTPLELVWEPGLAWPQIVDRIESEPISWDPVAEEQYERVQETYRRIAKEQGIRAAREWLGRQTRPSPTRRRAEGRDRDQGDLARA